MAKEKQEKELETATNADASVDVAVKQKEKIFSNKFIQNFLENESKSNLKNTYIFAEIASSLAYYLKSFSNINKLLDYVSLIFKHIFSENIILIILVSSTMSPFFKGTLRSNLNKTLLLLRFSQSLILFIKNSYEDILQYHTFYLRNPIRYRTRLKFYPYFYSPLLLSFRLLLKKQDYD